MCPILHPEFSIPLNARGILGTQAMTHYDWDAL